MKDCLSSFWGTCHTRYALLDLPLLFGALLFFTALFSLYKFKDDRFLLVKKSQTYRLIQTVLIGFGFGIVMGVKYWFPIILLFGGVLLLMSILTKSYKRFVLSVFIGVSIYLLSYFYYFLNNHSIIDFIRFEWYRFNWFFGKIDSSRLLIFQTLFTGKFETPWEPGSFEATPHWNLLWPISFISTIASLIWQLYKKNWQYCILALGLA